MKIFLTKWVATFYLLEINAQLLLPEFGMHFRQFKDESKIFYQLHRLILQQNQKKTCDPLAVQKKIVSLNRVIEVMLKKSCRKRVRNVMILLSQTEKIKLVEFYKILNREQQFYKYQPILLQTIVNDAS